MDIQTLWKEKPRKNEKERENEKESGEKESEGERERTYFPESEAWIYSQGLEGQYSSFDESLLIVNHFREPEIVYTRIDVALHQRASFVVLDVAIPSLSRHGNLLRKTLLPKVPHCKVIYAKNA